MTVFLSRDLDPAGPLLAWAGAGKHAVMARSLLTFAPVLYVPPVANWWFFYSSRAVAFGLAGRVDAVSEAGTLLACMGPGTAATLRKMGLTPAFVGEGQPGEVAGQFAEVGAGQTVFFPRARQSRLTVQKLLADRITVLDAVCYENRMAEDVREVFADVYVFSSPLNVRAFLQVNTLSVEDRIIAFGPSTAAALRERGLAPAVLARPTETALVAHLQNLPA